MLLPRYAAPKLNPVVGRILEKSTHAFATHIWRSQSFFHRIYGARASLTYCGIPTHRHRRVGRPALTRRASQSSATALATLELEAPHQRAVHQNGNHACAATMTSSEFVA